MPIRHAVPSDVDALAAIEAASYPPAEGASRASIAGRIAVYPDCFWLLEEGGEVLAFVNGFITDQPDLTDVMYDDPSLHDPNGAWQMIFGVNTLPAYRRHGTARDSCLPAKRGCCRFMRSSALWMRVSRLRSTAVSSGIRCA